MAANVNLYLMRHCEPTPGVPMDGSRSLTPAGVKQAEQMAAWLVAEIGRVDYVVTSPFARASETAEVMGKALGAPVIASTSALQPDGKSEAAWNEIKRLAVDSTDVLIVGHHPSLSALMLWLMGLDSAGDEIRSPHGSIAELVGAGRGRMVLRWLGSPALFLREEETAVVEAARALVALSEKGSYTMDEREVKRWVLGGGGKSGNC